MELEILIGGLVVIVIFVALLVKCARWDND
jgi:hypothetical protein